MSVPYVLNPELDLVLERVVDVPQEQIWAAWTIAEHMKAWFCPRPWSLAACEINLIAGGAFNTTMRSPEGEEFPCDGCYLEVIPPHRLVFTSVLKEGFRPVPQSELPFTAIIELESVPGGTKYTARAMHATAEGCQQHVAMGFHEGWNAALDQLVEYAKATWPASTI